jgi:hypothetical protein
LLVADLGWQESPLAVPRGPTEWRPLLYWAVLAIVIVTALVIPLVRFRGWMWKPLFVLALLFHTLVLGFAAVAYIETPADYSPLWPATVYSWLGGGLLSAWLLGVAALILVGPGEPPRSRPVALALGGLSGAFVASFDLAGMGAMIWTARERIDHRVCDVQFEQISNAIQKHLHHNGNKLPRFLRDLEMEPSLHTCARHYGPVERVYLIDMLHERGLQYVTTKHGSLEKAPPAVQARFRSMLERPFFTLRHRVAFEGFPIDASPLPLVWDRTPHRRGSAARFIVATNWSGPAWLTPAELDESLRQIDESMKNYLDGKS